MLFSKWNSDLISFLRQELLQSPSLHWCHWMGPPLQIPRHPRGFLALHNGLQRNKFYELVLEWKSLLMRSKLSCRLVLYNRGALKMFTEFTETHLQHSLFYSKVSKLSLLFKNWLHGRCLPTNAAKLYTTPF